MESNAPKKRTVLKSHDAQQKTYAWHAHSADEVLAVLGVDENGLTNEEAASRLKKHGKNEFTEIPPVGFFTRLFGQLKSPIVFVLLVAFALTVALEEYIDAGVIMFALSIAIIVGIVQEGRASRAFEKLANSQEKRATVIRAGKRHEISASDVVPGDVVFVQNGNRVPADLRLIHTKNLAINEAPLTGEWMSVKKTTQPVSVGTPLANQTNMAWMGTFVGAGEGYGVVIETGDRTTVGKLAQDVQDVVETETPLQLEMAKISQMMLYIIIALVIVIFAVGLFHGLPVEDMLLISIAIAVASVPEGLPAAITIILAVGMEALLRRGGLVRNLLAAETLGSTTYVLTDKTGTLTQAIMAVTGVIQKRGANTTHATWSNDETIGDLFDISLCATDAYVDEGAETVVRGDSVEKAILEAAASLGVSATEHSLRAERLDHLSFTSENRFAAGLSVKDGQYRLCVNGAPSFLLEHATHVLDGHEVVEMNDDERANFESQITEATNAGKRLVAVGYVPVEYDTIPEKKPDELLSGLVFVGVLMLADPVRPGVREAIEGVLSAGAEILLITGDNPNTALSIAQQVGIASLGDRAITGVELEKMSDQDILSAIKEVRVFARVLPQQKMRIAMILQQRGEIVAMTGDGINDAPTLRRANIGVAIGSGTEVAKEASDLVLVKDSFETIYAAIEEGRRIIANLRKIVGYLLSTSLSEVILIGAAILIGAPPPILPAQILWANVIEEGLMSVAFAFEKGEPGAMKRKPQDIHEEGILSKQMLWFMSFVVVVHSFLLLCLYFYLQYLSLPYDELRSVMFVAISVDSLFMAFAFRSLSTPIWKVPLRSNMFFLVSFVVSAGMLALVLTVPFMQYLLSYTPLPLFDLMLIVVFGLLSLMTIEVGKWFFFEHSK